MTNEKKMVNIILHKDFIARIDNFKKENGFSTRSQAMIHLLHNSLDKAK